MENSEWIQPITLQGEHVALEPMALAHAGPLGKAVRDGELWCVWVTTAPSPEGAEAYVRAALKRAQQEGGLAFVVRHKASGNIIGATRYLNVDATNQRLEIGGTWYAKSFQRTAVNTESKLLLLTHAFERLEAIAVEFRTHWHNRASRAAIARLGAKQDGILRQHQKGPNGVYRDTVVFSILNSEWPAVKQGLQFSLEARSKPGR